MTDTPERELIEEAFALLCRKYVQRSDDRQKEMGLQYTEAETHDLAELIAKFTASRVDKLEERVRSLDGAAEGRAQRCLMLERRVDELRKAVYTARGFVAIHGPAEAFPDVLAELDDTLNRTAS